MQSEVRRGKLVRRISPQVFLEIGSFSEHVWDLVNTHGFNIEAVLAAVDKERFPNITYRQVESAIWTVRKKWRILKTRKRIFKEEHGL